MLYHNLLGDFVAREFPADDDQTSCFNEDVEKASAGNGRAQSSVPTFIERRMYQSSFNIVLLKPYNTFSIVSDSPVQLVRYRPNSGEGPY